MNCRILVEQKEGDLTRKNLYQFNDYRVAQAICNLLDNVENMFVTVNDYVTEDIKK